MKFLRTPEQYFENLPDFPFEENYLTVDGMRMHYIDEGSSSGEVVLLLHGEPTWSYLYRKMIPPLVSAGFRVIAPDLIGFGKSDKPAKSTDYSYERHVAWMRDFISQLKLKEINLFCQDWGSLIGLRVAAENSSRFARIMVGNGFLPRGDISPPRAFHLWRLFSRYSPIFPIGKIVNSGCISKLSEDEIAAYDAPFPSKKYTAGARIFPSLVPVKKNDPAISANRAAWDALGKWQKPFLCVFGRNDPILGKADQPLIDHIPGAAGQAHDRLRGGHFIQEDQGPELAKRMVAFIQET